MTALRATPAELLAAARAAGLVLEVRGDALIVRGPSSVRAAWLPRLREHKPGLVALLAEAANDPAPTTAQPSASGRACGACRHLTRNGTCSRPVEAGLSERFGIRWPAPDHAERCPAFEARAQQAPAAPTGWADYWPPATEPECRAMAATIERGLSMGLTNDEAERAADRLHLAGREGDDRRPCLACAHLRAGASSRWWCAAERQPLPAELVTGLHRCTLRLPVEHVGGLT